MILIADDRERKVNVFLENMVAMRIERITTGDYVFIENDMIVATIERKSLSDLAASIKDGRMENHSNLEELKASNPDMLIIYLIEGSPFLKPEKRINGIPFKNLMAKIDSIMLSGAQIVWAKNEEHSAFRICDLFKRMEKTVGGGSTPSALTTPHKKSKPTVHSAMISAIPGISRVTAALLLKKWSVVDILGQKILFEELSNFTYDSGAKLGNRANALTADLTPYHTKIIASIPGITFEAANLVLTVVPFSAIVSSAVEKGVIAKIVRANGKKLGAAAESKILSIFTC